MKKLAVILIFILAVAGLSACDSAPVLFADPVDKSALVALLEDFKTIPQTLDQATVVTAYSLVNENESATQKEVDEAVSALKTLRQTICATPMSFIDGGLEPHVRKALKFDENSVITIGDCLGLEELDCTYDKNLGPKIRVAYDFRYFPNLKKLDLTGNNLQDFGGFSYLKKLEELSLADNPSKSSTLTDDDEEDIRSFDVLGTLPLRRLDLSGKSVVVSVSVLPSISTLESLDISENDIRSLGGIATKFPNLKTFVATDGVYAGVEDLGFCNALTSLDLSRSEFDNLNFLAQVQNLSGLTLDGVSVPDLSVLTKAPQLVSLSLSGCGITELSWISGFRSLQTLNLSGNQISDEGLSVEKTTVKELNLSQNVITSFVLTNGWAGVENLNLSENQLTSFSVEVSGEDCALTVLNLASNKIDSFNLGAAKKTVSLNLSGNNLSGLTLSSDSLLSLSLSENPLAGLTLNLPNLASLEVSCNTTYSNGIVWNLPALKLLDMSKEFHCSSDILKNLPQLETLSIHLSGVSVESVAALNSVKELIVCGGDDASIATIARMPNLETLTVSGAALTSPQITGNPALKTLSLIQCKPLTDLSGIKDLPALETLSVNGGNLPAPALSDLPALRSLTLSGCNLSSVSYLTQLPSLTALNLSGNGIQSIEVLGFPRLQSLDLSNNKLSSIDAIALELTKGTLDLSGNNAALYQDLSSFPETLKVITE
ncbi:MAG: leucine-rich repeat domain-containing protein [Clostridia bacterium]|nr:leucine-rich repeat domain-containing protein [Clostridia bacterium]